MTWPTSASRSQWSTAVHGSELTLENQRRAALGDRRAAPVGFVVDDQRRTDDLLHRGHGLVLGYES